MILIEYPNGRLEWRNVNGGAVIEVPFETTNSHMGAILAPQYHPDWYKNLDTLYVDEGI